MGSTKKTTGTSKESLEGQIEAANKRLSKLRSAEPADAAAVRFAHKKLKRAQRSLAKEAQRLARNQKSTKEAKAS